MEAAGATAARGAPAGYASEGTSGLRLPLRVAIGELATRDFIRGELTRITEGGGEDGEKREKKAKKRRDPVA